MRWKQKQKCNWKFKWNHMRGFEHKASWSMLALKSCYVITRTKSFKIGEGPNNNTSTNSNQGKGSKILAMTNSQDQDISHQILYLIKGSLGILFNFWDWSPTHCLLLSCQAISAAYTKSATLFPWCSIIKTLPSTETIQEMDIRIWICDFHIYSWNCPWYKYSIRILI